MSSHAARIAPRPRAWRPAFVRAQGKRAEMDPAREYELQKVRISINATLLILSVVGTVVFLFGRGIEDTPRLPAGFLLGAAVLGAATVTLVPWERLIDTKLGAWYIHAWAALDIVLIALAITVHGGPSSELFFLYGLTTTLFAITHTPKVQAAYLVATAAIYISVVGVDGWRIGASTILLRLAFLASLAVLGNFVSRELRRLLDAQYDVARRLQELDGLRDDFLSTVQHELRTPLAAIKGFATTLTSHWDKMHDEMRADLLARIGVNAGELDGLISQLLDFSLADRGHLRIEAKPCDVSTLARHSIEGLGSALAHHQVIVDVKPDTVVVADPACCTRIFDNLLSNAAKFSPPDTRITVWARGSGERVVVGVQDQGIGVPEAEAERIFDRFYRVDRGEASAQGGTGMGLAIVRQLVEAQGGEAWVESTPGEGSIFKFTLPAQQDRSKHSSRLSLSHLERGTATPESIRADRSPA